MRSSRSRRIGVPGSGKETLFALGSEYFVIEGTDFYDIAPDDRQFLMVRSAVLGESCGDSRFILVENFFEELRHRVPN